jgi:ABC-type bacteriocin/lantibiotic exporter with double-glycine peptidase domain
MGRTHVQTILQHTEVDCGPAALKHALSVFGARRSLSYLNTLCKTNRNGTSTTNMIQASLKLGYSVLAIENATLRHLTGALRYSPTKPRAVIVSYLYENGEQDNTWKDSGHWAAVSSYSASNGKIIIFDSYVGKKKSYYWQDFKKVWKDYDLIRKPTDKLRKQYKLVKKWQHRLLLVIAKSAQELPSFSIQTAKLFA